MKTKILFPAIILMSALLPVGAQAQVIAYEGFTQGANAQAVAGYSGTSEIGVSGTWATPTFGGTGNNQIRDGSSGQWGTVTTTWPAVENTSWNITQATRPMTSTIDLSVDGSYYLSYFFESDQADTASQVGFINTAGTSELMAGNAYNGGGKGITAYFGAVGGSVQQNADGTALDGGWGGSHREYQAVFEFTRSGGDLLAILNYYSGSYAAAGGVAVSTRTVDLGAVSDTFNTLSFKQSGWNVADEILVGHTLGDVVPVPEPSIAALGVLGILLLLKRKSFVR
jgi:hypothetical protein